VRLKANHALLVGDLIRLACATANLLRKSESVRCAVPVKVTSITFLSINSGVSTGGLIFDAQLRTEDAVDGGVGVQGAIACGGLRRYRRQRTEIVRGL
jgi:hypothetical protein